MVNVESIIKESLGYEYELIEGECMLVDADNNHYLTLKEINDKIVFLYPITSGSKAIDSAIDSMLINGHPDFIGRASLSFGYDGETLVLSVFGEIKTKADFEKLWSDGEEFKDKIISYINTEG